MVFNADLAEPLRVSGGRPPLRIGTIYALTMFWYSRGKSSNFSYCFPSISKPAAAPLLPLLIFSPYFNAASSCAAVISAAPCCIFPATVFKVSYPIYAAPVPAAPTPTLLRVNRSLIFVKIFEAVPLRPPGPLLPPVCAMLRMSSTRLGSMTTATEFMPVFSAF